MSRDGVKVAGPYGAIELTGAALASLVARTAESVPDIRVRRSRRRPRVDVDPASIRIELGLETTLGTPLLQVGEAVQRSVAASVAAATGLPASIDVIFEDLA